MVSEGSLRFLEDLRDEVSRLDGGGVTLPREYTPAEKHTASPIKWEIATSRMICHYFGIRFSNVDRDDKTAYIAHRVAGQGLSPRDFYAAVWLLEEEGPLEAIKGDPLTYSHVQR